MDTVVFIPGASNGITRVTSVHVYKEKKHPYDCFTNLSEEAL